MADQYRMRTEEELREYRQGLRELADTLNKFPFSWFLSCGALLGAYRQGNLIPYDSDIDIDFKREEVEPHITELTKELEESGFHVHVIKKEKTLSKLLLRKYKHAYSLRTWYKEEDQYRRRIAHRLPERFFDELGTIEIKGEYYPCPKDTKGYLEYVYGPNWHIPVKVESPTDAYIKDYHKEGKLGRMRHAW